MSEEHKRLFVYLMEEAFNRGNLEVADELVAPDFFNHEAPDSPGPEGFKATARWLRPPSPTCMPSCTSWWPRATWWSVASS